MITPDPVPLSVLPETLRVTTDGSSLAAIDATESGLRSTGVGEPVASGGPDDRSFEDLLTRPCSYATPEIPPITPPSSAASRAITSNRLTPEEAAGRSGPGRDGGVA